MRGLQGAVVACCGDSRLQRLILEPKTEEGWAPGAADPIGVQLEARIFDFPGSGAGEISTHPNCRHQPRSK